ncbi:MAG TPA: hypothetical protein EYQ50_09980 [Verrucomicrobiales bacterium]|nr:hypothetical protein [Verrucomicrobiales bacterium]HIL70742.1 hypothetical protein [Verrucomicrobiota bacterium]
MKNSSKIKGPFINRFAVRFLTLVFGMLIYWLLGFLLSDIASIPGPVFQDYEDRLVDTAVIDQKTRVERRISDLEMEIKNKKEAQDVIEKTSNNLQQTINQILDLQKISIEKEVELSESEQAGLSSSLELFLENQRAYQVINNEVEALLAQVHSVRQELEGIESTLANQGRPARDEYNSAVKTHRLRMASVQLTVLVPLLLLACFLTLKQRKHLYFPLIAGFGIATLIKVTLVVHIYFPSRYFKYVLLLAVIMIIGRFLAYLVRMSAFPKMQWLLKQYREAYERFLCPMCDYPIRTGPRKFLYWTRRTVKKLQATTGNHQQSEEAYTCPSCGTQLFEECGACNQTRHSLLPSCQHCGDEKEIKSTTDRQ